MEISPAYLSDLALIMEELARAESKTQFLFFGSGSVNITDGETIYPVKRVDDFWCLDVDNIRPAKED